MVTIADVAKRAGVSQTTVSHVLSGKRPVAATTRERIEQVIEELSFRPSVLARSLRIQRTQMVALIIPDITNPYYPVLSRGLQDALVDDGYHIFICNTDSKRDQEIAFIDDAIQRQVDGIVLSSLHTHTQDIQQFLKEDVAFVSLSTSINQPGVDQVATDDCEGAKSATQYLIQRGHQRIGIISGPPDLLPSQARLAGYRAALEEAHIAFDPALVIEGDFMRPSGVRAMHKVLELPNRPGAIFCANDLMAIGVMDVARERGIAIPDELAVVGYDDIEAASLISPALTTILNPAYEMGKAAGQLLLERLKGSYQGAGRHIVVPHRLIKRASA